MTSPWHSDSFPCSYISLQFTILLHEVDFTFVNLLWHQQHHITMRGRGDQAACRASPWTLHSPTLHSSINYTSNISITDMRGSSAILHHDIRKHFLIFSFNLSLLNSIWTNFKKINKRKKNLFFRRVHAFLLSAQRGLPANLMKTLYQGNFFKQIKKQGMILVSSFFNFFF